MPRPLRTVIIHGWSDCSDSFVDLKKFLVSNGIGDVRTIYYADYESREDNVTFDDVADGLNDRFIEQGFIDDDGNALVDLNVIVHSTGGLVIRHWLARNYLEPEPRLDQCPVRRIVMLAPANFGSPLAHRGKSFLGELFKGRWKIGDFLEAGRQLLDGLELGSPYQWRLAHRDLLIDVAPYAANRIHLMVLVGIEDYTGMRGWVNKRGTDGTVVIAGTPLDSLKLILDCTRPKGLGPEYEPYAWSQRKAVDEFAFGVLPGLNHGTIISEVGGANDGGVGGLVLRALSTRGEGEFRQLMTDLEALTANTYRASAKDVYQQFLVHAVDDSSNPIPDFTLEFFICRADRAKDGVVANDSRLTQVERALSDEANRIITSEFHPHSVDSSYRRFLVNLRMLDALLKRAISNEELAGAAVLSMRVYVPRVDRRIEYATGDLQNIVLHRTDKKGKEPSFLFGNTTTLLELRVNRRCDYVHVGTSPLKH